MLQVWIHIKHRTGRKKTDNDFFVCCWRHKQRVEGPRREKNSKTRGYANEDGLKKWRVLEASFTCWLCHLSNLASRHTKEQHQHTDPLCKCARKDSHTKDCSELSWYSCYSFTFCPWSLCWKERLASRDSVYGWEYTNTDKLHWILLLVRLILKYKLVTNRSGSGFAVSCSLDGESYKSVLYSAKKVKTP